MAVTFDYFTAPSDADAAAVLNRLGGPASNRVATQVAPAKRGLFGRRKEAEFTFTTDESLPIYDTVEVTSVDPVVALGTLEELLTGRDFDEIQNISPTVTLASAPDDATQVFALNATLPGTLLHFDDDRLRAAVDAWAQTEELAARNDEEVAALQDFARALRGLAARAAERGQRLYCWMSL